MFFKTSYIRRLSSDIIQALPSIRKPRDNTRAIVEILQQLRYQSVYLRHYSYTLNNQTYNYSEDICRAINFAYRQIPAIETQSNMNQICERYSKLLENNISVFATHASDGQGIGLATLRDIVLRVRAITNTLGSQPSLSA